MHLTLRDVRRQIGELVITGFTGLDLPLELRSIAREFGLGGAILFARNITSPEQVAGLAAEIDALSVEVPPWVAVDQEGGRVARLKSPFTEWPAMAALGRSGSEALAERFARALAIELAAVGISLDFAPVLDVRSNPDNKVIGDRALSDRAEVVASLGAAIVRSLQTQGVAACGKHFPGHGDTHIDSHVELPVVEHPPDRLEAVELVPFRAAVAANVAAIMTAHVLVPALDSERPATLSPTILGMLRQKLQFDGLVVSDDLFMGAIAKYHPVPEAARLAVEAGCDLLLLCEPRPDELIAALETLVRAVEGDRLPKSRVEDAIGRQRRVKDRFRRLRRGPLPAKELRTLLGRPEHVAVAEELATYC